MWSRKEGKVCFVSVLQLVVLYFYVLFTNRLHLIYIVALNVKRKRIGGRDEWMAGRWAFWACGLPQGSLSSSWGQKKSEGFFFFFFINLTSLYQFHIFKISLRHFATFTIYIIKNPTYSYWQFCEHKHLKSKPLTTKNTNIWLEEFLFYFFS